jgi:RNA polymerase sigma-70 factor (ECF subfamily)
MARLFSRWFGRTDLVQDLCQEVFLKVYHARSRYRENGAFSTWLYRIALNVAHDAGRRRRRDPAPLADHEPPDRLAPADALCQQQEAVQLVAQAVAELPEPLRVVLVLHHYEGLNFEEIARLTETPASTLKSRFAAALGRLRTRLHEWGWDPEERVPPAGVKRPLSNRSGTCWIKSPRLPWRSISADSIVRPRNGSSGVSGAGVVRPSCSSAPRRRSWCSP